MNTRTFLSTLCCLAASPALAEQGPAVASGASVSADTRDEYLIGDKMLVTITVRNDGEAPLAFPDLSARPWLVKFEFSKDDGGTQRRFTTPPEVDTTRVWDIPPRAQRQVLLEVPSASRMRPGDYNLAISIESSDTVFTAMEPVAISLVVPAPSDGDLSDDGVLGAKVGLWVPWVHSAAQGHDLYLNHATGLAPLNEAGDYFLARLPQAIAPQLTASRARDVWDRFIVWSDGPRAIGYAQLEGVAQPVTATRVESPWPVISLAGRGATASDGGLLVPVWIPAPKGDKGELRLLSVDARGRSDFRRITRLDSQPGPLESTVDSGGTAHFVVLKDSHVDVYSVREGATQQESLPVPGKRLWTAPEGHTPVSSRFAMLPKTDAFAGGLALLVATRHDDRLHAHWLSLQGSLITSLPSVPVPADSTLVDVLPLGLQPFAALFRADGRYLYRQATSGADLGPASAPATLVADNEGTVMVRALAAGHPVATATITATPLAN